MELDVVEDDGGDVVLILLGEVAGGVGGISGDGIGVSNGVSRIVGGITDSFHGHGRVSIWKHSTNHESAEWNWGENINFSGLNFGV